MIMVEKRVFSLLWESKERDVYHMTDEVIDELNISEVFEVYSKGKASLDLFKEVPRQIEDIYFRQGVLEELTENRKLLDAIKYCASYCHNIYHRVSFAFEKEATLYNLLNRIDRVNEAMGMIEEMYKVLIDNKVRSKGLIGLKDEIEKGIEHPLYRSFKKDGAHIKELGIIKSLKVGINLDKSLRPVSAMLLSFHEKTFRYTRSKRGSDFADFSGKDRPAEPSCSFEKMLYPAAQQLINFCDQFMEGLVAMQAVLYDELPFYELGIKIFDTLKGKGFYVCQPLMFVQGKTMIDSAYNINLAFQMIREKQSLEHMVYNTYSVEQEGNIHILTGANRGGKTTFTQAIGQIFWFAQMGYFIPAKKAAVKVVDGIFVHFPSQEDQTKDCGRFGYDCKRFAEIFKQLTSNSLLLMNESFSGTSHIESLTISFEIVKALQEKGVITLFNTHLHELGRLIKSLNREDIRITRCVSLVTGSEAMHQSFKVLVGEPLDQSYAQDIAIRYGLTFEQLVRDDRLRKVVSN